MKKITTAFLLVGLLFGTFPITPVYVFAQESTESEATVSSESKVEIETEEILSEEENYDELDEPAEDSVVEVDELAVDSEDEVFEEKENAIAASTTTVVVITDEITPTTDTNFDEEEKDPLSKLIDETIESVVEAIEKITPDPESNITFVENVELGIIYKFEGNNQVQVVFSKLPENSGSLSIEEVILTDEQVEMFGALSNIAYDITSSMENGSFEYDLKLPAPKKSGKATKVIYAESVDQLTKENKKTVEDSKVKVATFEETVDVSDLDHFTIFVVTSFEEVQTTPFDEGYNDIWFTNGAGSEIERVISGTNSVSSSEGNYHAEIDGYAFTRWNGYKADFPVGGYDTRVDVYLDMIEATGSNDLRFDFSSAINTPANVHRRDFIFSLGTNPSVAGEWLASVSNNSPGWPGNPARSPLTITETGWYTLESEFKDVAGVLEVTMNIYKKGNGTPVGTWGLSDPSDVIGSTVGGNRYGWFVYSDFALLPIDYPVIEYTEPDTEDPVTTFITPGNGDFVGTTDVTGTITDNENVAQYSFNVTGPVSWSTKKWTPNTDSVAFDLNLCEEDRLNTCDESTLPGGEYKVRVAAYDGNGNRDTSTNVTFILDRTAPETVFTSPDSGSDVETTNVTGMITDNANVAQYSFNITGPMNWSTKKFFPNTDSVNFALNLCEEDRLNTCDENTLPDGEYQVRVAAYDGNGNRDISTKITFILGDEEKELEATLEITYPAVDGDNVEKNSAVQFLATYMDDDEIVDTINFAIKTGTCEANTPGSNIAGFSTADNNSTYDPETGEFIATVDLSDDPAGEYCFVVNPVEQGGEENLREVRVFNLIDPEEEEELSCMPKALAELNSESTHEGTEEMVTEFKINSENFESLDSFGLFAEGDTPAEGSFTDEVVVKRTSDGFELYFYGNQEGTIKEFSGTFLLDDVDFSGASIAPGNEALETTTGFDDFIEIDTETGEVTFRLYVSTGNDSFVVSGLTPKEDCEDEEKVEYPYGTITNPSAGDLVSGIINLTAEYFDGDDENDDIVQWAVRKGTCTANTGTVAGNVDGLSSPFDWDGNLFSASLDTSLLDSGEHCFVFNPKDDSGEIDVRETVLFIIEEEEENEGSGSEENSNTLPVITLVGDNPLTIFIQETFTDPGATANDTEDGDITGDIVVGVDSVNTNTAGSYFITYNVIDSEGASAIEVERMVTVRERGGGGGGSSGGEVLGAFSGGEVLGAVSDSNQCGMYIFDYMRQSFPTNDPVEVAKLQGFLSEQGFFVPETGYFGPLTDRSVKDFQVAHSDEILLPWTNLGFTGGPSGYVYKTTRWKINNIVCPGSEDFPLIP